jgi:NTE family protein
MKALVLSGGGSKGAYQAGALQHILGEQKTHYDIVCGVSVGALNSSFIGMFKLNEEQECSQLLSDLWSKINHSNVYKRWFPFGRWHALWNKSFYDSSPLHELVKNNINLDRIRSSGKIVTAGAVSLNSGKYTVFNQSHDYFIESVIASASFPGMLTPVKFLNQLWIDGGIKEISPIKTAVDLGANEIDVIITSPEIRVKKFIDHPTTVDVLKRSLDLSTDKIMSNDIEKIEMYNKLALANATEKKYVKITIIRPRYNLIEDLLDFDHKKILEMMDKGYYDAKSIFVK